MTRYFIRSRHLAAKVAGHRVNIAFREMTADEAEPHIRAKEKRERAELFELTTIATPGAERAPT